MGEVGSAAALLLSGAFAWAGAAKAARRPATAAAFAGLGLPAPGVLARAVPAGELALAGAFVVAPRPAAVAALVSLAAFSAVLWRVAGGGDAPPCACFGGASAAPVSVADVARNGLLAGAAVVVAATAPAVGVPTLPAAITVATAALAGLVLTTMLRVVTRHGDPVTGGAG